MELSGITSDLNICNILISCFCNASNVPFAFSAFSKILKLGYHPNTITLTTLIKGLSLKGDVKKELKFHDKVLALGLHLNQVSYDTLNNGLCKIGETRTAMRILRQIERKLVRLDVVMYTAIIDSMCKDKLVNDACNLYSEVTDKRISPTIIAVNLAQAP